MKDVIAIDGPAGAGKSTIAKKLAVQLNYNYLDTGAMYRAVTLLALTNKVDFSDKKKIVSLAKKAQFQFAFSNDESKLLLFLNGQDVSKLIRSKKINQHVSDVACIKGVRDILVKKQQELAQNGKVVMDGRDIGTRVLPEAEYKFYLTATLEERAQRRFNENLNHDDNVSYQQIKENIKLRDEIDSQRKHSPLKKAEDAILIDTTHFSIEEVVEKIKTIIRSE